MTVLDHVLALALAIAFPVLWLVLTPATKRAIEAGEPGRRVRDYWHTLFELWLQGLAVIALWLYTARAWSDIGLAAPSGLAFWIAALLIVALGAVAVLQCRSVRDSEPTRAQIRERMAHLTFFVPHTKKELKLFSAISLSAGAWEEVAYRGFLIWYFAGLGDAWAVILSSLAFGFAHLYLGRRDAVQSAVVGAVLAGLYLSTGSLWLPIALHALIDLNSGFLGWMSFRIPESSATAETR